MHKKVSQQKTAKSGFLLRIFVPRGMIDVL
jgi:hypothetical protein